MSCGLRPRLRRDLGHVPLWWFCVGPAFKLKINFARTPEFLQILTLSCKSLKILSTVPPKSVPESLEQTTSKPPENIEKMYPKIIKKGTQNPPKWSPGGYPNTLSYIGPLYVPFWVDFGYPLGVTFGTVFCHFRGTFFCVFLGTLKNTVLAPGG